MVMVEICDTATPMKKIIRSHSGTNSFYIWLRLPFHKNVEIGFQNLTHDISYNKKKSRFESYFKLCFSGSDHAGLRSHVELWGLLIEFSVTDSRHWDDDTDTWEK